MEDGHGSDYAHKRHAAIAALLTSGNLSTAAKKVGVGEATIFRWAREPEFIEEYNASKRAIVENAIALMNSAVGHAVKLLVETMQDKDKPIKMRLDCAKTILSATLSSSKSLGRDATIPVYIGRNNGCKSAVER